MAGAPGQASCHLRLILLPGVFPGGTAAFSPPKTRLISRTVSGLLFLTGRFFPPGTLPEKRRCLKQVARWRFEAGTCCLPAFFAKAGAWKIHQCRFRYEQPLCVGA
jgi:hypothetical protein